MHESIIQMRDYSYTLSRLPDIIKEKQSNNVTEVYNDGQQAYYKVRMNYSNTFNRDLVEELNYYIQTGSKEIDDRLRDLLIDCREELIRLKEQ